jgi:hypothetical protein
MRRWPRRPPSWEPASWPVPGGLQQRSRDRSHAKRFGVSPGAGRGARGRPGSSGAGGQGDGARRAKGVLGATPGLCVLAWHSAVPSLLRAYAEGVPACAPVRGACRLCCVWPRSMFQFVPAACAWPFCEAVARRWAKEEETGTHDALGCTVLEQTAARMGLQGCARGVLVAGRFGEAVQGRETRARPDATRTAAMDSPALLPAPRARAAQPYSMPLAAARP